MKAKAGKFALILAIIVLIGFLYCIFQTIWYRTANKTFRIIVVLKSSGQSEFWKAVRDGVNLAAVENGVFVALAAARSENDITDQIYVLKQVSKIKPDAIVLAASDNYAIAPVARKIQKAGVKMISIDTTLDNNLPDCFNCFIGTNNFKDGEKAGATLAGLMSPGLKVAILSYLKGSVTASEREEGLKQGLMGIATNKAIETYYCDDNQYKAYEITKDLLVNHPEIGGIAGLDEIAASGAARAIRELGLTGRVKLVGFGSSIEVVKFLEEGVIQAIIIQKPLNIGYLGISMAVQCLKGKRIPQSIDIGSALVTKEKMYTQENQKLLFPFQEKL